jgi:hypothetical protein
LKKIFLSLLCLSAGVLLPAQTHVAVPVDDGVYRIIEQGQTRGLCAPLPAVKPYSRDVILRALNEILNAEAGPFGGLTPTERRVLEETKSRFLKAEKGLDFFRGAYHFEIENDQGPSWFSGDVGAALEAFGSAARYLEKGTTALGLNSWIKAYTQGDIGRRLSFGFEISGVLVRAPRTEAGIYNTYYQGYPEKGDPLQHENYANRKIPVYSQPEPFFPYTFTKEWDGFVFGAGGLSAEGLEKWPESLGAGSTINAELSGALFGDNLSWRFGRLRREWAGMDEGSSLVFNSHARPFMGLEASFHPIPWFAFSALTGVLEYYNTAGIKDSAWTGQNAFSIEQLELNYGNYLHFDIGSTAVWPKRFELGYIFPINNNFMYQNNIGDFDNMGLFFNLKGSYPGVASLWVSAFVDEVEISSMGSLFNLDRHMFAYQGGLRLAVPRIPFASLRVSYTKIEPYTYTHTRTFAPWYDSGGDPDKAMETSYMNNGVGIGHYLPPNSDEILVRFETFPLPGLNARLQYQMIRHGAEYGSHQVDGSSYSSELDPRDRSSNPILKKSFLRDGAYQWTHIIKTGASYRFPRLPILIFGEAGLVYSYYTDVPDTGGDYRAMSQDYKRVDTGEYPASTGFILSIGLRLFP